MTATGLEFRAFALTPLTDDYPVAHSSSGSTKTSSSGSGTTSSGNAVFSLMLQVGFTDNADRRSGNTTVPRRSRLCGATRDPWPPCGNNSGADRLSFFRACPNRIGNSTC